MDLSASSNTSLFDPLTKIETVLALVGTPVILTIFPSLVETSSTNSAVPNLSAVKPSTLAMGLHPRVCERE